MNATEVAAAQDAMDQIIEMVQGYQAKLDAAGYSPTAAEQMAIDYHRMLMQSVSKGQS